MTAQEARYLDFEGAIRAGKSTPLIWKIINYAIAYPGIKMLLARWTGDALDMQLKPKFYEECPRALLGPWNAKEEYQEFTNGSLVYLRSLKSSDDSARYCVAPETLILKSNLSWVRADEIREGDEIVGVDEHGVGQGAKRYIRRSLVEVAHAFDDIRYRIVTTHGEIITNGVHPFLVPRRGGLDGANNAQCAEWVEARDLQIGMAIKFLSRPWPDESDTWIAGLLDGEGWCPMTRQNRVLGLAQNPGPVLERAKAIFDRLELPYREFGKHKGDKCRAIEFCRIGDIMHVLGRFRPTRLLPKIDGILNGSQSLPQKNDKAIVLAIERIGRGPVVGIQTSTRTLITNGFVSHNSKFAGLTLGVIGVDQPEELPADIYHALKGRLSQPGFPQQMLLTPNPPAPNHWLADEFPEDNSIPGHIYLCTSVYDNRSILGDLYIAELEKDYPPGHVLRRRFIDGKRGLSIEGEAVYKHAFNRDLHVREIEFMPDLPLIESWDFGQRHPAVSWHQFTPWGWWNVLGEYMGKSQFIDETIPAVAQLRSDLFPGVVTVYVCCDPAGADKQGHGIRQTAVDILNAHLRENYGPHMGARFVVGSNLPEKRQFAIQQISTYLNRLIRGRPALLLHPRCEVIVDGLEAGYVYDDRSVQSARLPSFRRPKKDGFYDHLQNTLEYVVLNYGSSPLSPTDIGRLSKRDYLRNLQADEDEWDTPVTSGYRRNRTGY